jgi:hypothetical protein
MKKLLLAAAALFFCANTAQASTFTWNVVLSAQNEIPTNASTATGFGTLVLDDVAQTLAINFTFSGLANVTTAAHIHCCQATPGVGNVGVATLVPAFPSFPIGVTSGSVSDVLNLSLASSYNPAFLSTFNANPVIALPLAEAAFIAGLREGRTYLNVHTAAGPAGCTPGTLGCGVPGGEIRANLAAVPEPATLSLLGLGLAGLVTRRRRRA